ncbi:MAG: hypothetical protein R3C15_22160 [Thermoleophilia bacterium]
MHRPLALLAALLAAAALLVAAPAALAHGGLPGYTATITSIAPTVPGLELEVLEGDDRLQLTNDTGAEVVVLGYDGEPYLRFDAEGVWRNRNSPATYLNEERYAEVEIPPTATRDATPDWERVTGRNRFDWHDHRIHWMSQQAPPVVRADPDVPHRVFEWEVQLQAAGQPVAVAGTLDYAPTSGGVPIAALIAIPFALIVALVAFGQLRKRQGGGRGARRAGDSAGRAA